MSIDLKQIDNGLSIEDLFEKINDIRVYYVMDRLPVSQLAFLQIIISLIAIFELQFVIIDYWYNVLYKIPSMLFFNYFLGTSLILFVCWIFLVIFIPAILARGKLQSSGTGVGAIGGGGPSQLTIDNTRIIKLESSNQEWGGIIIPIDYTPYITKIIEKKFQELKKKLELKPKENKAYYTQFNSGYKRDYFPKEKHYSSHYSPYNSIVQHMKKIEQPIAQLNEYKKNIAQRYGLKKI